MGLGLYNKYLVKKTDTGEDVEGNVMVLNPNTDEHAKIALMSYAISVREDNINLSNDIITWLKNISSVDKPEEHTDGLVTLFENQKELMKVLGMSVEPEADILTSALFKDILICTFGEVAEALEPLAVTTKPWKLGQDKDEVREHVKEEVIDILFFVLELFVMAGMSPEEVVQRHTEKQKKNLIRAAGMSKSAEVLAPCRMPDGYFQFDDIKEPLVGSSIPGWYARYDEKEVEEAEDAEVYIRYSYRSCVFSKINGCKEEDCESEDCPLLNKNISKTDFDNIPQWDYETQSFITPPHTPESEYD